jgi:hypothetical protein
MILGGEASLNPLNITAGVQTTCDFYIYIPGPIQGPYTIMGLYQDGQRNDHVAVGLNLNTYLNALANDLDWATFFPGDLNESAIASLLKTRPGLMNDILITDFFNAYNYQSPSPLVESINYFAGLDDQLFLVGFSTATYLGTADITDISAVPLPPSVLLLGSGLLGLGFLGRRRRGKTS